MLLNIYDRVYLLCVNVTFHPLVLMDKVEVKTRVLLVRLYYENGSSAAAALRKWQWHPEDYGAEKVFLRNPTTLDEIRNANEIEVASIDRDILRKTVDNLFDRLLCVLAVNGGHIE